MLRPGGWRRRVVRSGARAVGLAGAALAVAARSRRPALAGRPAGLGAALGLLLAVALALAAVLAPALLAPAPAAAGPRPLTTSTLHVVGVEVQVGPATQSVPKGLTSQVDTRVVTPAASVPLEAIHGLLPGDLAVKGELSGPAFPAPVTLAAPAGSPLLLPTLPLLGTYTLGNLRLVSGSWDLVAASPSVVTVWEGLRQLSTGPTWSSGGRRPDSGTTSSSTTRRAPSPQSSTSA